MSTSMTSSAAISQVADFIIGKIPANEALGNGAWVSMRDCRALSALFVRGIGGAGNFPVITLEQARDASGTGAKALNITKLNAKIGGPNLNAANDVWVRNLVDSDDPKASYTFTGHGDKALVAEVVIREQDLDANGGFRYVRLAATAAGTTGIAGLFYIPIANNYQPPQSSALA